jgi:hypothetical protein
MAARLSRSSFAPDAHLYLGAGGLHALENPNRLLRHT